LRGSATTRGMILLAVTLLLPASASAVDWRDHTLSGTVGADLSVYDFSNTVALAYLPGIGFIPEGSYSVDRRLSSQFLDLRMNGPVVNNHFANYVARCRLQGTQIRAGTAESARHEYLNPAFTSHFGSISLFTDRRYPVKFYTGSNKTNKVRYEASNRTEMGIVDPGLAVVRRYETTTGSTGVQGKYKVNEDFQMDLEVKTTSNQLRRAYDFDENRNIWVDFRTSSDGIGPYYNVDVVNHIADHDVLLFVNFAFIDTVPANGQLRVILEEGPTDVDFVPVGLNSLSRRLDIGTHMEWIIDFSDPPGSLDLDQDGDIISGRLKYENEGPYRTEANFEINDSYDSIQRMDTNLKVFNNLAGYDISENAGVTMLTNHSSNVTQVGDRSPLLSRTTMNQTTGKWLRGSGSRATLSHSYFHTLSDVSSEVSSDSVTAENTVNSDNNIISGVYNHPTGWNRHQTDVLVNANILSNSDKMLDQKYSSEVRNHLEWRNSGFRWSPKHSVKYSKQRKKDEVETIYESKIKRVVHSNEWENKLAVVGENPHVFWLGALKVRGEHNWRRRANPGESDTTQKTLGEIGLSKKFADGHRLKLGAAWEKETYNIEPTEALFGSIELPKRDDEIRRTLRIDLQLKPASWIEVGGNAMSITTNESDISKLTASLSIRIPRLKIPIKSFLIKERRELGGVPLPGSLLPVVGVPPLELLRIETSSSYNFRKIRVVLAHQYTAETLQTEDYTYGEFSIKLFRDFDIF
jgi:hypothetical protein